MESEISAPKVARTENRPLSEIISSFIGKARNWEGTKIKLFKR